MTDIKNLSDQDAIKKLKELAESADICMFTTALTKLPLSSRPMSTQKVDDDGNLWFFSERTSEKNLDIQKDNRVQLFYASRNSSEYLSVFGEATIMVDKEKAKELWSSMVKAWFPEGYDDPELTIIKVVPKDSYYWDTKNNRLVSLIKIATAVVTGKTMDDSIEGKIKV